jgi:hypothetical protein
MGLGAAVERLATEAARAWREELRHQAPRGTFAAAITGFMMVGSVRDTQFAGSEVCHASAADPGTLDSARRCGEN